MSKTYLNEEICRNCGGACCKALPGSYFPDDFEKPIKENILKLIREGRIAIDWWEGDITNKDKRSESYFLRPKTKDSNRILDPSWGGECIHLSSEGCKLKPNERPKQCRLLEPKPNNKCKTHKDSAKEDSCIAWLKHEKTILEIINEIRAICHD